MIRGETHFPIAHELISYLDEAQRGKHIHEETAPWVFKGSVRKEAHDPTVHFLQTARPRSEASPWPGGRCLCRRHLALPSADFPALGSHDHGLSLPWLLTANPLPLLIQDNRHCLALMQAESSWPSDSRVRAYRSQRFPTGTTWDWSGLPDLRYRDA